jgi:DNA repair exonuclease SbcCD ATPase subunit
VSKKQLDLSVAGFEFGQSNETNRNPRTPWLMLIGENGRGNSSIFQAIALALSNKSERSSLETDTRYFVRDGEAISTVAL